MTAHCWRRSPSGNQGPAPIVHRRRSQWQLAPACGSEAKENTQEQAFPIITGGVLSILMVMGTDVERPTPLVAVQVRLTPAVSAGRFVGAHPVEDAIPDSRSDTLQFTVTALRYHPLLPSVPVIWGVMTGGVTSTIVTPKSALVFIGSLFPAASVAMLKKP